ncbi:protein of unassigned function [Methylobacterium oryzae CBMB20]|uniref:Protein of unassigned function n=1 Tax=Methylobacterium oryzae CBMB20 TaxID=693986 RepID=A0A089NTV4_9HYPH|nr:protein of unassigned function [Methylobacterium oryzae CBMB20]
MCLFNGSGADWSHPRSRARDPRCRWPRAGAADRERVMHASRALRGFGRPIRITGPASA